MLVHLGLPEKREVQTVGFCHPMLYCMGEPTYSDKGKVKRCKYLKKIIPQLAFCEALKLDAYDHVEKVSLNPVKKYQNNISNTQALVYSLFRAIGHSHNILKDHLAKHGDIGKLQTGTAKDYIHNQINEYPNGYEFGVALFFRVQHLQKTFSFVT
jgi:hypothetical protein